MQEQKIIGWVVSVDGVKEAIYLNEK